MEFLSDRVEKLEQELDALRSDVKGLKWAGTRLFFAVCLLAIVVVVLVVVA